jgi:aldehyde:ferredoxin oxidoreductase
VVQIQDGKFKGFTAGSSSAMNLFTPMAYGFEDYREAVKCTATLDRYGLDMFEFFGIMNFAKTLCDNGIIPKNQIDIEIVIDSLASMETWAKKISLREGLGQILADGFHRILQEFGEEAKAYAPSLVKGMHPLVHNPRIAGHLCQRPDQSILQCFIMRRTIRNGNRDKSQPGRPQTTG